MSEDTIRVLRCVIALDPKEALKSIDELMRDMDVRLHVLRALRKAFRDIDAPETD